MSMMATGLGGNAPSKSGYLILLTTFVVVGLSSDMKVLTVIHGEKSCLLMLINKTDGVQTDTLMYIK